MAVRASLREQEGTFDEEIPDDGALLPEVYWGSAARRRRRSERPASRLDVRRTLAGWGRGRYPRVVFERPAPKPGPLTVLWDVSASMADYVPEYFSVLLTCAQKARPLHVFAFGTSYQNLTLAMRGRPQEVQARLMQQRGPWRSGTDIGQALARLAEDEASGIRSRSTLIVISDGWDAGDPKVLWQAALEMRRRVRRFVWLNPHVGSPGFEPTCTGMQVAARYADALSSGRSKTGGRERP